MIRYFHDLHRMLIARLSPSGQFCELAIYHIKVTGDGFQLDWEAGREPIIDVLPEGQALKILKGFIPYDPRSELAEDLGGEG